MSAKILIDPDSRDAASNGNPSSVTGCDSAWHVVPRHLFRSQLPGIPFRILSRREIRPANVVEEKQQS